MYYRVALLLLVVAGIASAQLAKLEQCYTRTLTCQTTFCSCWPKPLAECVGTVAVLTRCTGQALPHEAPRKKAREGWKVGPGTAIEMGGCGKVEVYQADEVVRCVWSEARNECICPQYVGVWAITEESCDRMWNLDECGV